MKSALLATIILPACISLTATAGDLSWQTDFTAVTNAAAQRNLPVFAYFKSSDNREACNRFEFLVLKRPEFQNFANSNFILFQADLPRSQSKEDQAMSEKIKNQNRILRTKYGVNKCPMVVLLDYKGEVIRKIDYDGKSIATQYIEILKKILNKY